MGKFAGVVVINKEKGYTSHDVVAILKRLYKEKTGHSGTLDPNATGVLPVCIGRATKFAGFFMSEKKSYVAEVVLGVTTTTGDLTGEVLRDGPCPGFLACDIENVLGSFRGKYMQTPPMYSAIKVGGRKLYEIARSGGTVEREPREVEVFDLRLLEHRKNSFTISVDCSKGTYIRALCTDIGEKLGCGAAMGDLTRTRSGGFRIEDSVTIEEVKNSGNVRSLATPIEQLLPYPIAVLKPVAYAGAKNGNPVKLANLSLVDTGSPKHWLQADGKTVGLFSLINDSLVCEVML